MSYCSLPPTHASNISSHSLTSLSANTFGQPDVKLLLQWTDHIEAVLTILDLGVHLNEIGREVCRVLVGIVRHDLTGVLVWIQGGDVFLHLGA